jgi:hypothetical protein
MRHGLLRLAVILMIVWNTWLCGSSLNSISEQHSRLRSTLLQVEMDCANGRPSGTQRAFDQDENRTRVWDPKGNFIGYEQGNTEKYSTVPPPAQGDATCLAEYERATSAIPNPLIELAGNLRTEQPVVLFTEFAVLECLPPVAIGILWGALWGIRATVLWVLRGFGVEIKKSREPGESITVMGRLRCAVQCFLVPKNILALSVGMVALAVSYYFLVSLPASNRERLQFEKETAAAAKTEHDNKEEAALQAAHEREVSLETCSADADTTYWSYVKLNGKEIPGKAGTYSAPVFVWNTADKRKADALAECHRQFDTKR